MNGWFLQRVRRNADKLTKRQVHVVDHLARDSRLLAFATGAEIGRAVGVSESTVIRLAQALGYRGFSDMQEEARALVAESAEFSRAQLIRSVTESPQGTGVLSRVMQRDRLLIQQSLDQNAPELFEDAVDLVARADQVYVMGVRSTHAVAAFFAYSLRLLLGNVRLVEPDQPGFLSEISGLGPNSVLVALAFPRYSDITLRMATFAAARGCPVLAITDSPVSPIALRARVTLTAPTDSPAATRSYTAALSLCTALVTAVAHRHKESADGRLAAVEQTYSDWDSTK